MNNLFPPLKGVHLAGWVACLIIGLGLGGIVSVDVSEIFAIGYGGCMLGYCLLWAYLRFRYESIEFRTAVDVAEEGR